LRSALRMGFAVFIMASPSAFAAGAKAPLQVVVSREQQSLVVYDGDTVVATSRVSTGKAGHATPTGIFSILEKRRRHESNIYSNAPMPFMQRLTWSGIALHGSNHVPDYPASHGCVRLPSKFAARLFKMTSHGMHVIVSDRQVAPVEVADEMLFQPSRPPPQGPALSDIPLRPAIGGLNRSAVEVAMTDKRPAPIASAEEKAPIRILITRRGTQENVRDLQTLLNTLGYDAGVPDGVNGPTTAAAIETFQGEEGRPVDGKITPELIDAVFRKAGRSAPLNGVLRVRRQFQPVFEAEIAIAEPESPLGTHLLQFQNLDARTGEGKWFGISLENRLSKATKKRLGITAEGGPDLTSTLEWTLDRITVPEDVRERISGLLSNGSSLSITDIEFGLETGKGTDFITITRETRE